VLGGFDVRSPKGRILAGLGARACLVLVCAAAGSGAAAGTAGAEDSATAAANGGPAPQLSGSVLARPPVPSPVSAADGVLAWAGSSGSGHRFEVMLRHAGHNRRLRATSAVGRILHVKLGAEADGQTVVVYSHCPKGVCRLWWASIAGGAAHLIRAAPRGTSLGAAAEGTVTFVKPGHKPRLESVSLTGSAAHTLPPIPNVAEGSISDISATSTGVAFIVASEQPPMSLSQIWLSEGGGTPRLITQVSGLTQEEDNEYQFFVGLTLTNEFIYTYLLAAPGLISEVPPGIKPVVPGLRRITLALPSVTTDASNALPFQDARIGLEGVSYDPSDQMVLASPIPATTYYPGTSMPGRCATHASSENVCPVESFGPVSFPPASG
jgi:hypothetical protein